MAERRVATFEVEYEVADVDALLNAAFPNGRPALDPRRHLGLAISELMRPALIGAPGVRLIRAGSRDRPIDDLES